MSDSISEAEKVCRFQVKHLGALLNLTQIRNKRLAKLGNAASSQPKRDDTAQASSSSEASSQPAASTTSTESAKPQVNVTTPSDPASETNPFSQLGANQVIEQKPKINIARRRSRSPGTQSADGRSTPQASEPLEQWEDRQLSTIFRATLTKGSKDAHGHNLHYLDGTRAELEDSNQPLRLSTGLLDQALLEAASKFERKTTPLDYLLECWKRVSRHHRNLKKNGEQDPKFQVVKEARRLCMSYCIFAATMPEMFGYVDYELIKDLGLTKEQMGLCHLEPSGAAFPA